MINITNFIISQGLALLKNYKKKLRIADKVMRRLIESIGMTSFEYMTDRDKEFVSECYNLISIDLF